MNILSFGEIVWDVYPDKKTLGGAPLNFAAHSAILGAKVWLVSAVGCDELGKQAIKQIQEIGINTRYISVLSDKETGKCYVSLNENAVPSYDIVDDVAYDYIRLPEQIENIDIIVFGTMALRKDNNINALKALLDAYSFSEVFVDVNIRLPFYSYKSILFCLKNATIVKISQEELPTVTESVFKEFISLKDSARKIANMFSQIKLIIITQGENGSCCYDCNADKFFFAVAGQTKLVSTVGAGDSFGAAFLKKYMENKSYDKCLEYASKISAFVCSKAEAVPKNMAEIIKIVAPY